MMKCVLVVVLCCFVSIEAIFIMAQDDHSDEILLTSAYPEFLKGTNVQQRSENAQACDSTVQPNTIIKVDQSNEENDQVEESKETEEMDDNENIPLEPENSNEVDDDDSTESRIEIAAAETSEVSEDGGFVTLEKFKEQLDDEDMPPGIDEYGLSDFSTSVEILDADGGQGTNSNYASRDAGATILDTSEDIKSASNLLVRDKDKYMLMPRELEKKWVVISLSEDVSTSVCIRLNDTDGSLDICRRYLIIYI